MVKELSDGVTEAQILQKLWKISHWRKLSMIMVWERYCNTSPKPEFFLFSLFIFSFISQLIWVRLGWNFHRWFSIQNQVNRFTIDPFSLKFCTSQHSYPVPLSCRKSKSASNLRSLVTKGMSTVDCLMRGEYGVSRRCPAPFRYVRSTRSPFPTAAMRYATWKKDLVWRKWNEPSFLLNI